MEATRKLMQLLATLLTVNLLSACVPVNASTSTSEPPAAQSTPTVGKVQANGITLAYESFGPTDRETVLLIAGTGMQLVDWPMELVEELVKRGYRVIRFDNRDIGLSTHFTQAGLPDQAAIGTALKEGKPAPLPYTLRDMARDAVGLLDALNIKQAHIAGISMGGNIGQYIAIDFPERTLSLTSMMADSGNPEVPVIANPKAFEGVPQPPPAGDKNAFVEWQVKTWRALSGPGYPTDEATLRAWALGDYARGYDPDGLTRQQTVTLVDHLDSTRYRLNHLQAIKAPTVVLQGAGDPLQPVASAQDIAARIPGANLRIVPGLGHDIPVALVPTFAEAITAAADRATSQSHR